MGSTWQWKAEGTVGDLVSVGPLGDYDLLGVEFWRIPMKTECMTSDSPMTHRLLPRDCCPWRGRVGKGKGSKSDQGLLTSPGILWPPGRILFLIFSFGNWVMVTGLGDLLCCGHAFAKLL